jgi:c-di-GMP-binding flagellar brake protein YcgR
MRVHINTICINTASNAYKHRVQRLTHATHELTLLTLTLYARIYRVQRRLIRLEIVDYRHRSGSSREGPRYNRLMYLLLYIAWVA